MAWSHFRPPIWLGPKFWPSLKHWPGLQFGLFKKFLPQYLHLYFLSIFDDFIDFLLTYVQYTRNITLNGFDCLRVTVLNHLIIWLHVLVIYSHGSCSSLFLDCFENVIHVLSFYIGIFFFNVLNSICAQDRTVPILYTCLKKKIMVETNLLNTNQY